VAFLVISRNMCRLLPGHCWYWMTPPGLMTPTGKATEHPNA
jgi:hypothetical protein